MQETKLDRYVDGLFRVVERFSNKVINAFKSLILYFGFVVACVYIPFLIIFFIDVYYNGWRFTTPKGTIDIGFLARIPMVFFVFPFQIYQLNRNFFKDIDLKLLKISSKFYVEKVLNDCFKPIIADWREEYFSAINHNRKLHAYLINFRYIYAFILAMIQQSSLHRLFEIMRIFNK